MKHTGIFIKHGSNTSRKGLAPRLLAAAAVLCAAVLGFTGCKPGSTPSPRPGDDTARKAAAGDVVINEVVSVNRFSHIDKELGAADWVELKNVTGHDADISGWKLGDKPALTNALVFPEGTVIEADGYLCVFCIAGYDGDSADKLVAPLGVSRTGEKLFLSDGGMQPSALEVPALSTDISWARRGDGSYGYSPVSTFGAENRDIAATLDEALSSIVAEDQLEITELVIGSEGWVELRSIASSPVELADYSLSDDPSDPMKWQFPNVTLQPGEYAVVELNVLDPENEMTAGFKVSRSEGTVYLFDMLHHEVDSMSCDPEAPAGVSAVKTENGVAYTAYPTKGGENSGPVFTDIGWKEMDISDPSTRLYINEVLPINKYGIVDSYGDRSDWVELLNPTDEPVSLSAYCLSDDPNDLLKWRLPDVELLPHSYSVIFLSGKESLEGEIHAPFNLSKADGGIYLSCLDGMYFDKIEIPEELSPNVSIGRNGQNQIRYYAAPTPGASNSTYGLEKCADAGGFDARSVYISEVSAVAAARSGIKDWVELYNGSSSSVSLNGWRLTDDPSAPDKFKLDGLKLSAGEYAVITCSDKPGSYYHAPFSISNAGDTLYLINADGAVCDVFNTGATSIGVTSGRSAGTQTGERCFFATATKGYRNSQPVSGTVAEPEFSSHTLYHSSSFELTLSCRTPGAEIRYTTDGSVPTKDSKLYDGAIRVSENTAFRAKAFLSGYISSPDAAQTYLFRSAHTLPVVCLTMSHSDYTRMYKGVYDTATGGMTKGDEVPCFMEYFIDGRLAVSSGAGVRVSGASTAAYPQKSLGLFFRAGYGRSHIDFPFFDDTEVKSFRSLTLRNSGQDAYYAHMRDMFVSRMALGMNLDVAAGRSVIVYINGQYRGIYDLKENMNEDFAAAHNGVSRNKVETIHRNQRALSGSPDNFLEVRRLCRELDLSKQENFDKVAKYVDTDSFIDYLIVRTYFFDGDMFNQKYWHTTDNNMKWRAILYDSDYAMFGNSPTGNLLYAYFNPNGVASAHGYITNMDIYVGLNKNKKWREEFIIRYIMAAKGRFSANRALAVFDDLVATYRPEMKEHINKWKMPNSYSKWETEVAAFRECVRKRPNNALSNLKRFYGLSDSEFAEYERIAKQRMGG